MSKVVAHADRFRQIFIESESPSDSSSYLRHLEGVREPYPIVVPLGRKEYLRFVSKTTEGLAVQDPVAITLVCRTQRMRLLGNLTPSRLRRSLRSRRQPPFRVLDLLPDSGHRLEY